MSDNNFIKNITSKDLNLSKNTIKNLIYSVNIDLFKELDEKSEFIFPFIKERIIKDFLNFVNIDNLKAIFEFSKIYSYDFEDLIVLSWVKFASEDLTDEILELFENGCDEQKAYCAKYFSHIKDTLALDFLEKNALCDFEPLRLNCAIALSGFNDSKIVDEMKNIIENDTDEFKQLNAFQFLIAYGDKSLINYILKNAFSNPFLVNIITYLKNFYSLDVLKDNLEIESIKRIFAILIDNYPENITLDTLIQYEIFDFIKLLSLDEFCDQFVKNILYIAKNKFNECLNSEIYNFDLDKNTKEELKNIVNLLNKINLEIIDLKDELNSYNSKPYRFDMALNVIKESKIENYSTFLADLINNKKLDYILLSKTAIALKELNKQNLIDKNIINEIENENVKALVLSVL